MATAAKRPRVRNGALRRWEGQGGKGPRFLWRSRSVSSPTCEDSGRSGTRPEEPGSSRPGAFSLGGRSLRRRRQPCPGLPKLVSRGRTGAESQAPAGLQVSVSREGTVSGYGMVALEDVQRGELLFAVPRAVLLSQKTTTIRGLLEKEHGALQSQSGWVPLLLALLYEYLAEDSPWRCYFSLWPDLGTLQHPMFWSEEERKQLLQGTGVPEAVEKDLANISHEYGTIVLPFLEAHPDIFPLQARSLQLYRQLVAMVMAYSFQEPVEEEDEKEPSPPMMVPAADILNHVANHNANLEYSPEFLRMVATQPIPKGQEIFNTYGQMANWQLVHMYGFAEPYPANTDDTADIQMATVRAAALQGVTTEAERCLMCERWDFLCQLEMVGALHASQGIQGT
ncbi:N-lysine methyltransferase SETD6 isoform X5 [Notamacropus eugenii]|uniref:N-lysine methyltransferase SETD6 isoform X5 n=1 Tax=Notamacropus eugenii TaxID=9315 RepID=UPI003B675C38